MVFEQNTQVPLIPSSPPDEVVIFEVNLCWVEEQLNQMGWHEREDNEHAWFYLAQYCINIESEYDNYLSSKSNKTNQDNFDNFKEWFSINYKNIPVWKMLNYKTTRSKL